MLWDPSLLRQHKKNYTKMTSSQFNGLYSLKDGQVLGQGTYGVVVKVRTAQGQELAIKEFNLNATRNSNQIIREVDSLRILQHPNIVRFHDCYIVDDNKFYIVIEYCPGGALSDYLRRNQVTENDKVMLCKNIAQGLAYAHQKKIVHRDLKPDNILIGSGNIAKICDFGCSVSSENASGNEVVLMSHVGSPAYMDKRITVGEPYDMSVDIYAMGMIFYSIFKGEGIYDNCRSIPNLEQMRSGINRNFDERMDELVEGIPEPTRGIIKNCLQNDHTLRYKASEICTFLEEEVKKRRSMMSTMQSRAEEKIEDQSSVFAVEVINYYQNIDKIHENLSTRKKVVELLNQFKEKFEKIRVFEGLKYVEPKTKEQFVTFVLFYYYFWLDGLMLLLTREPSPFAHKYPEINPASMQEELLEKTRLHINSEREKYYSFFMNCIKKQKNRLSLLDPKLYLPTGYKKMVQAVASNTIQDFDFDNYEDKQLRADILMFCERRIKKQFYINLSTNDDAQSREDYLVVESIGTSL